MAFEFDKKFTEVALFDNYINAYELQYGSMADFQSQSK